VKTDKEGHLYSDKGINLAKGNNISKYICTQYWNIQIYKADISRYKGERDSNTITVKGLYPPLSVMDRSSRQKLNKETAE
jgi:hypothetical protein